MSHGPGATSDRSGPEEDAGPAAPFTPSTACTAPSCSMSPGRSCIAQVSTIFPSASR